MVRHECEVACFAGLPEQIANSARAQMPIATATTTQRLQAALRFEELPTSELSKLTEQINNNVHHLALAAAATQRTKLGWIERQPNATDIIGFFDGLTITETVTAGDALCAQGHNLHPLSKVQLGLSPLDIFRYSAEGAHPVPLRMVAIRRAAVACREFPTWDQQLNSADLLLTKGLNADEYTVLPIHPWQFENVLSDMYSPELADKTIINLDQTRTAIPTLSMRSLVDGTGLSLKVALAVQLTTAVRNISPATAHNVPSFSAALRDIVANDEVLSPRVGIVGELAGMSFRSPEVAKGRNLTALLRESYQPSHSDGVTVSATVLGTTAPNEERVINGLVTRLAHHTGQSLSSAAERFFAAYANLLLPVVATMVIRYGVGLEAHLQNVLVQLDKTGLPTKLLLRDFGGLRLQLDRFLASGAEFSPHPDSIILAETLTPVRDKAAYSAVVANLAEVARLLLHIGSSADRLWGEARKILETTAEALAPSHPHARTEIAFLSTPTLPQKAFLRMLLANDPADIYRPIPNPLAP